MKRSTLLLLISMLMLFGLVACEKPAPGSQQPAATPTVGILAPGATLPPSFVASPTVAFVATVDPLAPLPASPTPTADPNVPPAEATPLPVPEQPAEPAPEPPASTGETIHIVAAGENLYRIGLRYGFTYQELAAYNNLANPDRLDVGQQIRIPARP